MLKAPGITFFSCFLCCKGKYSPFPLTGYTSSFGGGGVAGLEGEHSPVFAWFGWLGGFGAWDWHLLVT